MSGIFICYRREDSAFVSGLIRDRLAEHFGLEAIFTDVDAIPLGVNFKRYIDRQVGECDIFLAMIGKEWLGATDDEGRPRLEDPKDFVRVEIESALKRDIPVIPLLVGDVTMPSSDQLPRTLKELALRHGAPVRPQPTFASDIEHLVRGIEKHLEARQAKERQRAEEKKRQEEEGERQRIAEEKHEAAEAIRREAEAAEARKAEEARKREAAAAEQEARQAEEQERRRVEEVKSQCRSSEDFGQEGAFAKKRFMVLL